MTAIVLNPEPWDAHLSIYIDFLLELVTWMPISEPSVNVALNEKVFFLFFFILGFKFVIVNLILFTLVKHPEQISLFSLLSL